MTEIFDDIRKLYLFRTPCPELMDYIEFFSETSLEATHHYIQEERFSVKLFPSFTPTIWLNLGAPYQLLNDSSLVKVDQAADILVLRSTTLERKNFPTDNIFTIKFLPMGFEAIFGYSQATIGTSVINAHDLLGSDVIQKVKGLPTLNDKALFLEDLFLAKLQKNFPNQFYVATIQKAIALFSQSSMEAKLQELAGQLHVSEKTFYRYFQKAIGTNPKDFFLVTRCREALSVYKKNKHSFSPYDFGYYDFAHFSKEVKRFTGAHLTTQTLPD
ncbi:AraC family transcriptional regulator [Adhaeribacter arboris]|uniref:AraC family transcriptional regulator n=1 Tax=Adhaeribacter arboris TaxID=2072846 RepID=A0A2T2Y8V1_9BACT|nr:helix-turn-helix domain-containing protein [Adhaeribacter arboris]PSR51949.1 AraC family transcriptional regulator [Adhaeribacter arboris]